MTLIDSLRMIVVAAIGLTVSSISPSALADVSVVDDGGHIIRLAAPAQRVVSLAPHATELLFAAGAGSKVVGVSAFSDFPIEAKNLPSVGGSGQLDLERIISLKPDLIIAWKSGNNARQLRRLRQLGLVVFESEPRSFEMVASSLERLGTLVGSDQGKTAARRFRERWLGLQQQYAEQSPVTVFYQIWSSPLMTLNDTHMVSQAIKLCGGINIFGHLKPLVPTVSREAVLNADPDMIITSSEKRREAESWRALNTMKAVQQNNLFTLDSHVLNRAGPRLVDATRTLCETIAQARKNLRTRQ